MSINISWVKKWYYKDWVRFGIEQDAYDREGMAMTLDKKVIRPISLDSYTVKELVFKKKAVSFHRTIESYLDVRNFDNMYQYDLIIDIDITADSQLEKQLEAVSIVAKEVIELLESFGLKEKHFGIKYSGNHGIHIRIPMNEAIRVFNKNALEAFPFFPRAILRFISDTIKSMKHSNHLINYVEIDPMVASPKHMIRALFSINEKLPGVSIPLSIDEIEKLPSNYTKYKLPNALELSEKDINNTWLELETSENIENLIRIASLYTMYEDALDSYIKTELRTIRKYRKKFNIQISDEKELFPPCIKNILNGIEDGRKRAVFILINFFANIGWDWDRIYKELVEWNNRNPEPLRERYIEYQVQWHKERYNKGHRYLPPNCDNSMYYRDMGVCSPDDFCPLVKNPLAYFYKKFRMVYSKKKTMPQNDKRNDKNDNALLDKDIDDIL